MENHVENTWKTERYQHPLLEKSFISSRITKTTGVYLSTISRFRHAFDNM